MIRDITMQTSTKGKAVLKREEGTPLRSYRCPAGKWTIYAGITSAAGVGKIGPNMVITEADGERMLSAALAYTFEPRVEKHMPGAMQHEFDAGVLFDWNTGAIHKASWVPLWLKRAAREAIGARFRLWNRGGGKVLPGLVKRRERELNILLDGVYPKDGAPIQVSAPATEAPAVWALTLSPREAAEARIAFGKLGYLPDPPPLEIPASAVRQFQADHGLTVDGIIGRATLSTLQRRLDASTQAKVTAGSAVAATPVAVTDYADQLVGVPHMGPLLLTGAALYALVLLWRYRDAVAAEVQGSLPRVAAFLRSV
jgi:lysozyme